MKFWFLPALPAGSFHFWFARGPCFGKHSQDASKSGDVASESVSDALRVAKSHEEFNDCALSRRLSYSRLFLGHNSSKHRPI